MLQHPKITRKNKHNQDTRNSQPTQRRPTLQYPTQPVAGGYRMHGALWVRGCFVTKRWRMYCSDTRVGEWRLAEPIVRSIQFMTVMEVLHITVLYIPVTKVT